MNVREAVKWLSAELEHLYDAQTSSAIALWILEWITKKDTTSLLVKAHEHLTKEEENALSALLKEHLQDHKPLAYIFGSVPFLSLDLTIRPPLLIPRSETEYWCGWLIKTVAPHKPNSILDLCCGSGCIGLSLAQAFPYARVVLGDISPEACSLTEENAVKNSLTSVRCILSDLYKELPLEMKFDLIVSNPPYISLKEWSTLDRSVKEWEDPRALRADDEGLALLKKIITEAPRWLSPAPACSTVPQLVIEIGHQQGAAVEDLFKLAGFSDVIVHKDPAGNDRFVTGRLVGVS
ncbi:peptide chain release factor N(5)-glutamine methyltransferase [Candidatus Dependentiae bacterium]|nr:peptide chain release factor N(5)-glutamine methyltransferase [Candidatus Dependentiae bacterium]